MTSRDSLKPKAAHPDGHHQTLTGLVRLLARQAARDIYLSSKSAPQIDNKPHKDSTDDTLGT